MLQLDVTGRGSIAMVIRDAIALFDGLDAVVNNAVVGLLAAFEATPEATTVIMPMCSIRVR